MFIINSNSLAYGTAHLHLFTTTVSVLIIVHHHHHHIALTLLRRAGGVDNDDCYIHIVPPECTAHLIYVVI